MREGGRRYLELYLVVADPDFVGPGVRRLADILRAGIARECREAVVDESPVATTADHPVG
jgi:hypothetical protein